MFQPYFIGNGNVAPVRNFHLTFQLLNDQERRVVLIVDAHTLDGICGGVSDFVVLFYRSSKSQVSTYVHTIAFLKVSRKFDGPDLDIVALLLALFWKGFGLFRTNVQLGVLDLGGVGRRVVQVVLDDDELRVHLFDLGGKGPHAAVVDFANFNIDRFSSPKWFW